MPDDDEYEKNELEEVLEKMKRKYHKHMQQGGGGGACCRGLNDYIMLYSDPKFPVVNPSPTVDECLKSIRIRDIAFIGGIMSMSWGYGYILGKPARLPTASTSMALGLTFACLVVLQDTRKRFMGYSENSIEVEKYGLYPKQPQKLVQKDNRFPIATAQFSPIVKPIPRFDTYKG